METEPCGSCTEQLICQLSGEDGLYKQGLNGFDMYDYLGYVYMGWRTTGGIWQNHIINSFIMNELSEAGYETSGDNVEAAYGTKPESDRSDQTDNDYAWIIQYQGTEKINTEHHLKYVLAGNGTPEEALANETEVLKAWGDWYAKALESVETLVDEPSGELTDAIASSKEKLASRVQAGLDYAEKLLKDPWPDEPAPGSDEPDPGKEQQEQTKEQKEKVIPAKTGDQNSVGLWVVMIAGAVAGIVLPIRYCR